MKFNALLTIGTVAAAAIFSACGSEGNTTTNVNVRNANASANMNANSNVAVLVNNNSAMANSNRWANANVSRADYDRDRAEYERDRGESKIGTGANDSWLWFKTRAALLGTSDLRESTINVDVENDVITLRGTVETAAQKAKAMQVANGIEGKKSVRDQLKVAPNDSMTNTGGSDNTSRSGNANTNRR
jgi:hyperosmotically inducible protein